MALTITPVPDCNAALGPSQFSKSYQVVPALSDYPTGGYPITSAELGLGSIYGAKVIAGNAAAALFTPKFVLAAGDFGANPAPDTTINMMVTVADVQEGANTDLSACKWIVEFLTEAE